MAEAAGCVRNVGGGGDREYAVVGDGGGFAVVPVKPLENVETGGRCADGGFKDDA